MNRKEQLDQALEAMYFGYKAMIFQPDQRLSTLGLSRVHHRLLFFIHRQANGSVNQLLARMDVSKQYLNQPLKKMIELGYVTQTTDVEDRRIKRLKLSNTGTKLESELTASQHDLFKKVMTMAGKDAEQQWLSVMNLLNTEGGLTQARFPPSSTNG
ncbi:MAG: DNA-binding MarR family transcriptional regulator [Gammaproteobacteria bacterium]|jgi:DNA-binding MarR family transcriptional regulator